MYFSRHPKGIHPETLPSREWKRMVTGVKFHVFDYDLDGERPTDSLFFTIGEARLKTKVNARRFDNESTQLFHKAKSEKIDPWTPKGVVSTCDRARIPLERIMSMRWREPPEEVGGARRADARMVVPDYTDPDLTTVRSEAPTISRLGRQTLLQACSFHRWNLYKCDVKNCIPGGWQGICVCTQYLLRSLAEGPEETQPEGRGQRLWPEGRTTKLVEVPHLNPACTRLKRSPARPVLYDQDMLVGIVGIYVDDCLICGHEQNHSFIRAYCSQVVNVGTAPVHDVRHRVRGHC